MVDLILAIAFGVVAFFAFKAGAKYQTVEKFWNDGVKAWFKKNVQD